MGANVERLEDMPDGLIHGPGLKKFLAWTTLKNSCPAGAGPGKIYCSWAGKNCAYDNCPRRIFEEVAIDLSTMPAPPKLKKRLNKQAAAIQQLQNKNDEQQAVIKQIREELEQLKKDVEVSA